VPQYLTRCQAVLSAYTVLSDEMSGCCFCLYIALVQHMRTRADKNLVATQHELVLPLSMPGDKAGLLFMAVHSARTA